ncbi:methyl-accepting chemotaxis protein [Desulfobaculum xiamenense]|uniref:Methyl-accepting chemotaxis protein n=1 Tax=Desulfobaculum xiamenense TaxID=995050 RepID=A0A846QT68_9BACT|nr:methyl-accepting chemotaxis protein [Desulfobaculum xiamenense]
MFAFHSIRTKTMFFAGLCLVASLMTVLACSTYLAREAAQENALREATAQARMEASRIRERIDTGLTIARSTAQMLAGYRKDTAGAAERSQIISMQYEIASLNEAVLGVWSGWEPNAFDGRDDEFRSAPGCKADGRFVPYWNRVGGMHFQDIKADLDSGAWYTNPRDSGRETVLDPIVYDMSGQRVTVVSLAAPIRVDGRSVGVVGVDVTGDFLEELADSVTLFGVRAEVTLVSGSGVMLAHTDRPDAIGKPYADAEPEARMIMKAMSRGEERHFSRNGQLHIAVPVSFGKSGTIWGLALEVDEDIIFDRANAMAVQTALIGGGCLALAMIVLWFLSGRLVRPIQDTAVAVKRIADGDLDVKLDVRGDDEVSNMQAAVNVMVEHLRKNITEIENQVRVAREKTAQAEAAMVEAEEAGRRADRARSEGLLQAADRLGVVVERISTAMEEISAQSEEIRRGTDVQKDRIASTATAMEEMNATVLEVAQNAGDAANQGASAMTSARDGREVVGKSIEAMGTTQKHTDELHKAMEQLDEQARAIGSIMNVIDDIADQTNLLALNAAIEAARAGDAGRGFAVVADEVRKLAEKTMNATKEVGSSIVAIQKVAESNITSMERATKDLQGAVEYANRSGEMLGTIVTGTEAAASQIQGIATAAAQQSAASDEINRSIEEVNRITLDTARSIEETVDALREMTQQTAGLATLIQELRDEAEM